MAAAQTQTCHSMPKLRVRGFGYVVKRGALNVGDQFTSKAKILDAVWW